MQDGFEDPRESAYYDTMGRVNLYDLSFLANLDDSVTKNTFDTVPMGIMEVSREGDKMKYVRSNESFRDFIKRAFDFDLSDPDVEYEIPKEGLGSGTMHAVEKCRSNANRAFIDEKMEDGSTVHSFVRWIGKNPVNEKDLLAVAVLSITEPDESTTFADIARSLAADYYNVYVIDMDTDDFIEYSSQIGEEKLVVERRGEDFFESAKRDTMIRIYEEDREPFLQVFSKENVIRELDAQGVFTATYRLIDTGKPMYVNMKITRMQGGNRIIMGISIIDAQMKQQEEEKKLRQERISLGRIAALSSNYIVLYTIDPVTGQYTQYSPSNEYESLGLAKRGEDFFADVIADSPKAIDPEDLERHLCVLTKNNLMREIQKNGLLIHNYRLLLNGEFVPVSLRATLAPEDDGEKILLGIAYDDREEYRRRLEEAYEKERDKSIIYTHIALSLARGYTDLYYVNMDTDGFIEFHTDDECGVLTAARRGNDFFEGCERDAKLFVHPEDQPAFVRAMNQEFLKEALRENSVFEMVYRRIIDGAPFYVRMRVSRIEEDRRFIVLAVTNIDEEMKHQRAEQQIKEERIVYARLHALTGNFIVVYVVDPQTDHYREFSATDDYIESFAQAKEGTDFFNKVRDVARLYNHPDDLERFLSVFTKESVMGEVERSGIFTLGYRLMMEDEPIHVQMKAAMVEEKEGPRLIVGLNDIDAQVRQEEEYGRRLAKAQFQINIDALTGVKNKHAYLEAEEEMNRQIENHSQPPFSIVVLDVNDLKNVNDTSGHQAGDQYLRDACKIICDIFDHSPVYRIGGDEFLVISQGSDYECIEELIGRVNDHNAKSLQSGGIVIACGMAKFENDACVASVFERADQIMYENKGRLKSEGIE